MAIWGALSNKRGSFKVYYRCKRCIGGYPGFTIRFIQSAIVDRDRLTIQPDLGRRSPAAARRLPTRVNLRGRGTLTGRARVPARREGVLEANGVFSRLIGEGSGLREPRIARTRSLPSLVRQPRGSGRKKSDLLPEAMDQFQVHAARVKFSNGCELPAGQG